MPLDFVTYFIYIIYILLLLLQNIVLKQCLQGSIVDKDLG